MQGSNKIANENIRNHKAKHKQFIWRKSIYLYDWLIDWYLSLAQRPTACHFSHDKSFFHSSHPLESACYSLTWSSRSSTSTISFQRYLPARLIASDLLSLYLFSHSFIMPKPAKSMCFCLTNNIRLCILLVTKMLFLYQRSRFFRETVKICVALSYW